MYKVLIEFIDDNREENRLREFEAFLPRIDAESLLGAFLAYQAADREAVDEENLELERQHKRRYEAGEMDEHEEWVHEHAPPYAGELLATAERTQPSEVPVFWYTEVADPVFGPNRSRVWLARLEGVFCIQTWPGPEPGNLNPAYPAYHTTGRFAAYPRTPEWRAAEKAFREALAENETGLEDD